jgi:serine/threonine protein kinase
MGVRNVIQYVGMFETDTEIILLTEYISGNDLRTLMGYALTLSSKEIKTIIQGISFGLQECHRKRIIHRDLKP